VLKKGNAIEHRELRRAAAFYSSPDQGGWQLISSPGLRKKQAAKSCAHYSICPKMERTNRWDSLSIVVDTGAKKLEKVDICGQK
jgi:hypothetical protein